MTDVTTTRTVLAEVDTVRRQAALAVRMLARPTAVVGVAREVALGAFQLAAYPLGMVPRRHPPGPRVHAAPATARTARVADPATAGMPVVLVHGYVHNRSAFLVMSRALKRAGFRWVHGLAYNPLVDDVPASAAMLATEVERVLAASGASACQIVGHSMGGIVARYYVQELGGEDTTDTVVTLGSPHRGTFTAYLGPGRAAAQLRPGSPFLRRLEETARPSAVRWISYYSDMDLTIVPAANAKLAHPALQATNVRLCDTGHLSLLLSGRVLRSLVEHLADRTLGRPAAMEQVASLPSASQRRRRVDPPAAPVDLGVDSKA